MLPKRRVVLVLLTISTLMFTACASPTVAPTAGIVATAKVEPTADVKVIAEPTATSEVVATSEPVKLTIYHTFGGEDEAKAFKDTVAAFKVGNPGIEIEDTTYSFADLPPNTKLAFDSGTGPDIVYGLPGGVLVDLLVKAGYLVDLTDVAKEKGWLDRTVPGSVEYWNWNYEGKIYGAPHRMAPVGVYYNKEIFAKLGLEPPAHDDWKGYLHIIETAKNAGYIPFALGNTDGYPAEHYQESLVHANVAYDKLTAWEHLQDGATLVIPEFIEATQTFLDWEKKGYFTPDFEGMSYNDMSASFREGNTAMAVAGDWVSGDYAKSPFDVGFFAFPQMNPDIPFAIVNSPDNIWVINKATANPEAAIKFVDFMLSEQTARIWFKAGFSPTAKFDPAGIETSELHREIAAASSEAIVGYYLSSVTPTNYTVWSSNLQIALNGGMTAEEFAQSLQDDWKAFKAGQ